MGITPIVDQNSVHFFSLLVCLFEIPVLTKRFRVIWILLLKQTCWALLLARALCHETIVLRVFASWTAIAMQRFSYQTVSPDFGRWCKPPTTQHYQLWCDYCLLPAKVKSIGVWSWFDVLFLWGRIGVESKLYPGLLSKLLETLR